MVLQTVGSIPRIIRNDDGLYEGNLKHYYKVIFGQARNLTAPYHNFRHMLHVTMLCASACEFYRGGRQEMSPQDARHLLIAALFHDFNHTGRTGNDDLNIMYALRGLNQHLLPEDREWEEKITHMIKGTEFPYVIPESELSFTGIILRDADMSQAFSVAWIQQVIFGLAEEMALPPIQVLRMQKNFLSSITFQSAWARFMFKDEGQIEAKIQETEELLALVE